MPSRLLTVRAGRWRSPRGAGCRTRGSVLNLCWRPSALKAVQDSNNFPLERIPMTIETSFDSNYRKVLVAARRARQIQSGSAALVHSHSTNACRIAQDEMEARKISYVKIEGPVV